MENKLFDKYIEIDNQIKRLESEKELLRDSILVELRSANLEKASTGYGTFTRAKRINWQYTAKIDALEEKVELAKVKEVQSGKAKSVVTEHLRFTPTKIM